MAHPYFRYYDSLIQQDVNGLKLVLGGTGLGKTSAIVDVVKLSQTSRKYVYCANRVQLLNEMAERLDARSVGYVHLKNDTEVLVDILNDPYQTEQFRVLLQEPVIEHYIKEVYRTTGLLLSIPDVLQACEAIRAGANVRGNPLLGQLVGIQASKVMSFFKRIITTSVTPNIRANSALSQRDHAWFLQQPIVRRLFPFIDFRNDDQIRILLVTIQKAFFGFFDGERNVTLTNFQDANGKVIFFLDEFDFLETDLIELICEDVTIAEPFKFVQYFHEAMSQNKLPLAEYPVDIETRKRIEEIVGLVDDLPKKYSIDFPRRNHFTCTHLREIKTELPKTRLHISRERSGEGGISIFQTNRTIANVPLYLMETVRAFDITTEKTDLSSYVLFNAVYYATYNILYLFRELGTRNSILRAEIMRHAFETTTFREAIDQIRQLPPTSRRQPTQFQKLLDSGYGLYEIQDLQQESDHDEVKLRHYSIHTTPERILRSLATSNLVFGLSATADIPRSVRNFSEDWLYSQDFVFHQVSDADVQIIQDLNNDKQQRRGNKVEVLLADELQHEPLLQFIEAVSRHEFFGNNDTSRAYRARRVKHFFATLVWINQNRDTAARRQDTHILFFDSFKHIEYVLQQFPESEEDLFAARRMNARSEQGKQVFTYYEVDFEQTTFVVVFYDAAKARSIESENHVKEDFYRLFWQEKPVLLVTTYPSAGNGVNLQYYPDEQSRNEDELHQERTRQKDFKGIHLLDSPYFYFERVEQSRTVQENDISLKKNIWYMAKLYLAKVISEGQFKAFLSNIRDPNLNAWYLRSSELVHRDALLNQLATFIQALGRIERVWSPMEDQVIRLDPEVYHVFESFCVKARYEDLRQRRETIISSNLKEVFAQISAQALAKGREVERYKDERLSAVNERNYRSIQVLLQRLNLLRSGDQRAQDAKQDWLALREAVLRHDFHNEVLHKYSCIFQTPYYHDGLLYINEEHEVVPHTLRSSDYREWRLDSVYQVVAHNATTRRYFEARGYELGFNNTTHQFFTPYCYQSILTGAIGEAAIAAVFEEEGMLLTEAEIPNQLFELVDTQVARYPWYVDCKNYREHTLRNFILEPGDPEWRPKLNDADFRAAAHAKLRALDAYYGSMEPCKLVYLNLAGSNHWSRRYFDAEFNEVGDDFDTARIVVIPGVLNVFDPEVYCDGFVTFLSHMRKVIQHDEHSNANHDDRGRLQRN